MEQKIRIMLQLQDSMNTKVHAEWREQNFAWFRAIWVESAELLDHYGWKWWKHQPLDVEQVQLELIDIWHFGLSMMLQQDIPAQEMVTDIASQLKSDASQNDFPSDLEDFVVAILTTKKFDLAKFARLMAGVDLDFDKLYLGYVGKNVLNFFRQDHGYKEGSYTKVWAGREDNEHLAELAANLDANSPKFQQDLYGALAERYSETVVSQNN